MFITSKYNGYNRHGEQIAAGYFLILMQPKTDSKVFPAYQDTCNLCGKGRADHTEKYLPVYTCPYHGIVARLRARAAAKQEPIDSDFQEITPQPDCADCQRHTAEVTAQGCVSFHLKSNSYKIRGLVRYVRMKQFGNWMMGTARILNTSITLSGSYGSDGLPCSVPDAVYDLGVELPDELYQAWNKGGGWNGAGSEAQGMKHWALKTFPKTQALKDELLNNYRAHERWRIAQQYKTT